MKRPPVTLALLGAGARGARAYGNVLAANPDLGRYVAVAEPNAHRREALGKRFGIPKDRQFAHWEELLDQPQLAQGLVNATQDSLHVPSTLKALEKGYHVLLEKPMALSAEDCFLLTKTAREQGRILQICHVLRFSRAMRRAWQLIGQGKIGEVVHINHSENVGYWHFAHSYVRGHWRRKDESSFLMLTKACHDMDLLAWWVGKPAQYISSMGSLKIFNKDKAPPGSTARCTDGCAVEKDCPYSALKQYLNPGRPAIPLQLVLGMAPSTVLRAVGAGREFSLGANVFDDLSDEGILKALKTGPYGRCVYHCDNDVVDHQTTSIQFEGGATASFTLNAFTQLSERTTRITGTDGEIRLTDFRGILEHRRFSKGSSSVEWVPFEAHTHGGGDRGMILNFLYNVSHEDRALVQTSAEQSLASHLMAFATEESRLANGKMVKMEDFHHSVEQSVLKKTQPS